MLTGQAVNVGRTAVSNCWAHNQSRETGERKARQDKRCMLV